MINAGLYLDSRTFIAAKNKLREDPGARVRR
jgi:hypothetical protein